MNVIEKKIKRLAEGNRPRVLDLFAGCGGISLGFHTAGYELIGAVEIDKTAAATHALNFFSHHTPEEREVHAVPPDITSTEPTELLTEFGFDDPVSEVDLIVGGPPCQAFARVGRAKLREVSEHPEAFLNDPRSNLYLRYLHYVKELRPVALLMENVPDVLNYGGHNIADEVCEVLEELGYCCKYTLLNSSFYGVPQMRERMFLVAIHNKLNGQFEFPTPTNYVDLPSGYFGTRSVALKNIATDLFSQETNYTKIPEIDSDEVPPAITTMEAIADLPVLTDHLKGKSKRGARKFDKLLPYRDDEDINAYVRLMRNWPGFENEEGVYDHVIRHLPRDYAIFAEMEPGDQYPEAHKHAHRLLKKKIRKLKSKGIKVEEGSAKYEELKAETVPPYDPGKFPNKWRKLEPDMPSRTLLAHLGKDSYSHIHPDSKQARTISVREAARLQSFPDGFRFCGAMNAAFRQIGNSVPPLMAKALAEQILQYIKPEALDVKENSSKAAHSF